MVALILALTAGLVSASEEEARVVHIPVHTALIPGLAEAFGAKVHTNVSVSMLIDSVYRVDGAQVGIVNISEGMYGIPIGLVNIVRNGILNVTGWSDGGGYTYV